MLRFPLRATLALVALVLLVLPWAGWLYVREMERFLVTAQEQTLAATARAVATALHERPALLVYRARGESDLRAEAEGELRRLRAGVIDSEATARERNAGDAADSEIAAILKGLERASSRIWVVNREYRVLALAGSLKQGEPPAPGLAQRLLGWLLTGPTEEFDDAVAEDACDSGSRAQASATRWAWDGTSTTSRRTLWRRRAPDDGLGAWIVPLVRGKDPVPLDSFPTAWGPAYSPDQRWIAYTSNEAGQYEIYVTAAGQRGARRKVSLAGGEEPVWSPRGDELYYRWGREWFAVASSATRLLDVWPSASDLPRAIRERVCQFPRHLSRWPASSAHPRSPGRVHEPNH